MGRKKESSDEYEPLNEEEQQRNQEAESESEQQEQTEPIIPEILSERRAKINRREIVESEDSDRMSSASGSNSDDYKGPDYYKQKKKGVNKRQRDSDESDGERPKKRRAAPKKTKAPRRKAKPRTVSSASSETPTEDESEPEPAAAKLASSSNPVDKLRAQFPHIPRSDITRVYYQNSCQFQKAADFLASKWTAETFKVLNNGETKNSHTTNSASSESEDAVNLKSSEDEEEEEDKAGPAKKKKQLNSSDEEWCPQVKKTKPRKPIARRVSSSEDDMAQEAEAQMSDAADEDYSDDEPVAKRSDEAKRKILNFLMNATLSELQTVESISALKARVVHEARPFKSLSEFKSKSKVVKKAKFFNDQLLANVEEALKGRTMVTNLLKKCESTTKKLRAALADNAGGLSIKKPKMMSEHLTLKPYQHRGLYWYTTIHEMNIGAILADEMGLGKTVQTISFLAWLKENQPSFRRPHLVVCPSSTLENWRREFECWLPSFKVHSYYGEHRRHDLRKIIRLKQNMKDKFKKQVESDLDDDEDDVDNEGEKENKVDSSEKDADQFENIDVVLTTYQSACSGEQDRVALKKLGVGYAIFDEGHMLKNMKTQRYQQLMKIGAKRRILLTGTPLQNNLLELMSLLKFIMPEMLEKSTSTLTKIFQLSNSESDFARKRALEAKAILDPFVMRRIKANVLKDLPPKTDETMNVKLPDFQRAFYDEIKTNARLELAKRENGSEGTQKRLKNFYMELRKTANHPLLLRRHFTNDKLRKMAKILCNNEMRAEGNVDYIFEDFEVMSDFEIHRTCEKYHSLKKFRLKPAQIVKSAKFDKLMELMPPLFDKDSRVVLFSQFTMMMDIMEVLMDHHQIGFLRLDGSTPVESRLDLIDEFNADFDIKVFMISTKAGGLGINLTSADTVIIHDIDSNPYNDKQAEDRCHRVGQTKPVHIIRLIAEDTVEIKMRASAVEKLKLESKVCHEDTIKYKTSPLKKPKIELDAKLDDSIIDEEEISQDELVGMLEEKT